MTVTNEIVDRGEGGRPGRIFLTDNRSLQAIIEHLSRCVAENFEGSHLASQSGRQVVVHANHTHISRL
jgi:hypothetical protein